MRKRGIFGKAVLGVSLLFVTVYTIWAAWEQHRTGMEPSPTLTQWVYTFWGIEVTLLCLKRIFAKRDAENGKDDANEQRQDLD